MSERKLAEDIGTDATGKDPATGVHAGGPHLVAVDEPPDPVRALLDLANALEGSPAAVAQLDLQRAGDSVESLHRSGRYGRQVREALASVFNAADDEIRRKASSVGSASTVQIAGRIWITALEQIVAQQEGHEKQVNAVRVDPQLSPLGINMRIEALEEQHA